MLSTVETINWMTTALVGREGAADEEEVMRDAHDVIRLTINDKAFLYHMQAVVHKADKF